MDAWKHLTVLSLAVAGVACSSSDPASTSGKLATEIPVTREACTPFGDTPRPVETVLDNVWGATCIGGGGQSMDDWDDPDGNSRQACLYEPAAASDTHKLPLVIYFHPSLVGVDITLAVSNIRSQLDTADLTGDPDRPGFILLAPYGRVTERYYPLPDNAGSPGWDNWYRQLEPDVAARTVNGISYPENVDAATVDHYVQEVIDSGKVDTRRIYVMGWSNGSAMGILYSLNRPMVAATAVYSSPDPLAAFNDPCEQTPVAGAPTDDTQLQVLNPSVPIYQIHNACDIAGLCPNTLRMRDRLIAAGVPFTNQTIDNLKQSADACEDICGTDPNAVPASLTDPLGYLQDLPGYTLGTTNHLTWPFGWTDQMFTFLREHPKD
ncbi:hypothetical protein [Solimonas marina]|uniref:Uncharacterized protein n=1 Tax=Solimonas marina TaxID=2714601 RepID=A0A969W793_9GAMM|nr:hypothetical protein [Solimonas marina]NKF20778.1 hypothetical protein [Solimonas marina]